MPCLGVDVEGLKDEAVAPTVALGVRHAEASFRHSAEDRVVVVHDVSSVRAVCAACCGFCTLCSKGYDSEQW